MPCEKKNTEVIWGLNWKKHFPIHFGDYSVELSDINEFLALKKCPDSFLVTSDNSHNSFVKDINSKAKEAYLQLNSDFFVFKIDGEVVGLIIGEVRDWSSYYIRFMNVAPAHRKQNLSSAFCSFIEAILASYGVDKVQIDVAPTNMKQVIRMGQLGYVSTGNVLSERFGAYIQMTKFLRDEAYSVFNNSFTLALYPSVKGGEAMKPSSNL